MSPALGAACGIAQRFPRVSGDEPEAARTLLAYYEFSPRERG